MPIYDQSYRPWTGDLDPHPKTWWVIARTGVQLLWKKGMIVWLLISTISFLVRSVQIYMVTRLQDNPISMELAKHFSVNASFFVDFFKGQSFFMLIILIMAGSGIIANDRRVKALQIYFSKPVNFWDYVIGKWCVIAFYGSLITILPALLLFLLRILFAADAQFISDYYWIPFSILGFGTLLLVLLGSLMLVFSALSKNGRTAAILFFIVIFFTEIVRALFSRIPSAGIVSVQANLRQTAGLIFNSQLPFEFSPWASLITMLVLVVLSLFVIKLKIKPTEVVR